MSFSILKFVKGFAFWKGEIFGKILQMVVVITICLAVYNFITSRANIEETTQTAAGDITNIEVVQDSYFIDLKVGWFCLRAFKT